MKFDPISNRLSLRIAKQWLYRELLSYEEAGRLTQEQLCGLQRSRLEALCRHAKKHSPYYQELISDELLNSSFTESSQFLAELPLLTKTLITENYPSLVIEIENQNNIKKSTGGSTGKPFCFELDYASYIKREAVMWRGYGWAGYNYGQRALYLWGVDSGVSGVKKRIKDTLYHRFYNRKMLNSFAMNEHNMGDYVESINQYKPTIIVSYVNPILTLAQYILDNNIQIRTPKRILTGAEPLHEFQREIIQKAFGCKVMNTYGCREFMLIGAECSQQNGLHINSDHLVVETVNESGESVVDEEGDIVITDLFNYGMPLIRYKNGDRAILSSRKCPCGNPFPLIEKITGRKLDSLRSPNGSIIPGEFFPHLLKDIKAIKQFQVIQNRLEEIEMSVVLAHPLSQPDRDHIQQELDRYTDGSLTLSILIVDDIALTASGKYRVTICKL